MLLLLFTLGSAKGLERGPRKPEPNMPPDQYGPPGLSPHGTPYRAGLSSAAEAAAKRAMTNGARLHDRDGRRPE